MEFKQSKKIGSYLDFTQLTVMLCLFLGAMNFLGKSYYWFFIAVCLSILINKGIFKFNFSTYCLLLLGLCIAIFGETDKTFTGILKSLLYPMYYYMGFILLKNWERSTTFSKKENQYQYLIIVMALGLLSHVVFNLITNINAENRNTIDFWTNTVISATGQAALGVIIISTAVALLFTNAKILVKFFALLSIGIVLGYNLILAGRTLIFMTAIIFMVALMAFLLLCKNWRTKCTLIIVLLVVIGIIAFIYWMNIMNIKTFIQNSNLYKRFFSQHSIGITEDSRLERKLLHLQNMSKNFWGGRNSIKAFGYAHDIFLDTYDDAGIIAFVAIVAYMICSFRRVIQCLKSALISSNLKLMIICIYCAIGIEFLMEPVLLGIQWLFILFCIIDGMTTYLLEREKRENRIPLTNDCLMVIKGD